MRLISAHSATALALLVIGCSAEPTAPDATPRSFGATVAANAWGPESRGFNLEVILRGDGFGLVKFRQPNDDEKVIYLTTMVRSLAPNTDYLLQRAVDTNLDGNCTSTSWLTLGAGLDPLAITTNADGTGVAYLWRDVSAIATGGRFDIHFRVVRAATGAVVLTSNCYEYVVSQ